MEYLYVALVTHNTGHGPLTEILTSNESLAEIRKCLEGIDTRITLQGDKFSFGSIEAGVTIYRVEPGKVYGKYDNRHWEQWKPYRTRGGLTPDSRGYGQQSQYNPDWFLWDRINLK